ncbi:MAG: ATP-binding protein, partial [Vulcanimicrobiota bacterium]
FGVISYYNSDQFSLTGFLSALILGLAGGVFLSNQFSKKKEVLTQKKPSHKEKDKKTENEQSQKTNETHKSDGKSVRKQTRELETIQSLTDAFASVRKTPELCSFITEKFRQILDAVFCNIYLINENQQYVFMSGNSSGNNSKSFKMEFFAIQKPPYGQLKTENHLVLKNNNENDFLQKRFNSELIKVYGAFTIKSQETIIGFLELGFNAEDKLNEDDMNLISTLIKSASIALVNSRLYKKLIDERDRLKKIMANMSDGVMAIDEKNTITSFNRAAELITGYPKNEVIGKTCCEFFQGLEKKTNQLEPGEERITCTSIGCLFKLGYGPSENPIKTEHIVTTPHGKEKILDFSTNIESDELSDKITFVSVFRDVSKIKELERLRSDFIDTISHELRTPLTSIKGYVSTLLHPKATFSPEEMKDFLKIINEESDRLNRMVNDLLEASQLQKSILEIKMTHFNINEFIGEIVRIKDATTSIHDIEMELDDEAVVNGDPKQMKFVFQHLIDNAIKYSPTGGRIKLSTYSQNPDKVTIMIEDEGIGIPADHRDKIFNLFHRVDNRSTRRIYGVGLGLYIAKKIIEAHGRKIWVESGLGGGATFVFSLKKFDDKEKTISLDAVELDKYREVTLQQKETSTENNS